MNELLTSPADLDSRLPDGGRVWVAAQHGTETNRALVDALCRRGLRAARVDAATVAEIARPGDRVVGRVDVRPSLDGADDGLRPLQQLERSGVTVLNRAGALLTCHDKLQTALRLGRLGLPQPATLHVDEGVPLPRLPFPVVVKPRFGSWGADVFLCETPSELEQRLRALRRRPWFRRQGALLQELVPSGGRDLRIVVSGGRVVGAIERVAAPGEWRTNVALGGARRPVEPPAEACRLALAAASAVGADLVGVDLLPAPGGGYLVLELNGAVDFTSEYSLGGRDIFEDAAETVAASFEGGLGAAREISVFPEAD